MPFLKINDGCSVASRSPHHGHRGKVIALIETVLIVLCFAAIVGQPAPDVNESHYLTKAKHFWNPSYCPGDIFLASSFSHLAFYVSTGWLTKFVSLSTYAWVGRAVSWTILAIGWRRVCHQLSHVPLGSVLTAVLMIILNLRFHLAGEWVVGGFEAKSIAYGFVLLAMGFMLERRWGWVWPMLGVASMFHILVGGWTTIAVAVCFLFAVGCKPDRSTIDVPALLRHLRQQSIPLTIGLGIALIGVIPPLLTDAGSEMQQLANKIHVVDRISHHLDFASFPVAHISRFTLLVIVWWSIARWLRTVTPQDHRLKPQLNTLATFTATTLVFALLGLVLSGMAEQGGQSAIFAHRFLRFYFFRLSDFSVPASIALLSGHLISRWIAPRGDFPHQVCAAIFIGCVTVAGIALAQEKHAYQRPNADRRLPEFPDDLKRNQDVFKNWKRVCGWIREHTPTDAVFITPVRQQTFKWYAHRTEVCCWKDVPQNPAATVQWKQRIAQLTLPQKSNDLGIFVYSDEQLRLCAQKYDATHLIALQSEADLLSQPTTLKRIYPEDNQNKTTWVVYEF